MKTDAKERAGMRKFAALKALHSDRAFNPRYALDLIADVEDAAGLLERTRPILCGLAIEVERKQKVEGTHYLTDAVAVKDEVVAFLEEPKS